MVAAPATNLRRLESAGRVRRRSILDRYLDRTPRSAQLAAQACEVLPSGCSTDTRFFEPYGIYVDRAAGTRMWDVDGNEYLDFSGGHGASLLGHRHPVLVKAVREAIGRGARCGANQPQEVVLAREVLRHLPSAQRIRFTASGTEATMLALRLARTFTGRETIVCFSSQCHGSAGQTLFVRPNDVATLERVVADDAGQIAGFMVEPVGAHFGAVPIRPDFLRRIQSAARSLGALFILDEGLSGFRVALGGAQALYGLQPDLTTLAKIVCGGMPSGAVAGRADVLDLLDFDPAGIPSRRKILHRAALTADPVSAAAGIAVLREIERTNACARANLLGELARRRLNEMAEVERLPFAWYGEFSAFHMFCCHTRSDDVGSHDALETFLYRPPRLINRFRMALNVLGFDINTQCTGMLSAVHGESDVVSYVKGVAVAAAMLKRDQLI